MNDPVSMVINGIVWLAVRLGILIGAVLQYTILFVLRPSGNASPPPAKSLVAENQRQAGCREVVLGYVNHLGYIARECMTREEIKERIDGGIRPNALKREIQKRIDATPGIILGTQTYLHHPIKLPYSYRNRHGLIIGRSGHGKTNLLRQMVVSDIENNFGVGVLAPEQELITEEILPYIPENRIDDVVYINPADTDLPIPFNPLHLDAGDDLDQAVDNLITIFSRLSNDLTPRMREIMYHTFYALLERKESTLLDVEILLDRTDDSLRNEIIHTTQNPRTARFFQSVFPTLSRDACLPIYSRIAQLISPRRIQNLLCQPGKSFSFREAMDEGKILLFNLSDGILGEQTAQLLGQLIIAKIQIAVMSRADTPKEARFPFYLYLDEFPTFTGVASDSYQKILARSRKYNFGVTLAMQQTHQIPDKLLREILGNVSTILAFQMSYDDSAKLRKEFLVSLGNEAEPIPVDFLQTLKIGEAWGKIGSTVFPLKTALADQHPDPIRAKEVIQHSRKNYGIKDVRGNGDNRYKPDQDVQSDDDEDNLDYTQVF